MEQLAVAALFLTVAVLLFLARWHDRRKLDWPGNGLLCAGYLCLVAVFFPASLAVLYSIFPGSLLIAWGSWRYTSEIRRRLDEWKRGPNGPVMERGFPGSRAAQ